MTIPESRIKLIRKALQMTQEQLAQRLGIGKAALSMIETGRAGLSARNRNILVQELNVNSEWLDGDDSSEMFNLEPDLTAFRLQWCFPDHDQAVLWCRQEG